jgi:hypothetical protein
MRDLSSDTQREARVAVRPLRATARSIAHAQRGTAVS